MITKETFNFIFQKNRTYLTLLLILYSTCCFSQSLKSNYEKNKRKNKLVKTANIANSIYLSFIRIIGDINNSDENKYFYYPSDILTDKEENIYVLDVGNYCVKKFNKNLEFLISFGRKGRGPGEFLLPDQMGITSLGEIIVSDIRNLTFNVFARDGKWIRQFKFGNNKSSKFKLTNDNNIILYNQNNVSPLKLNNANKSHTSLVNIYNGKKKINEIGRYLDTNNPIANLLINNIKLDLDNNENFYIAYSHLNRIEKYSHDGDFLFLLERPIYFKNIDLTKEKFNILNPKEIKLFFSKVHITSVDISIDQKNRLWVLTPNRYAKEEEKPYLNLAGLYGSVPNPPEKKIENKILDTTDMYDIELFSSAGLLITKIRLNHFVNVLRIFGDRLFIVDKYHNMQIYEYKILDL